MPAKSVVKKVAELDLKNSAYFASELLENNRYKTPDKFYFSPNQSIDYLLNTYTSMKNLYETNGKRVESVLFIGGVLYSGLLKGLDKSLKVEVAEIDHRVILSQLYAIYCIQNNGTKNSTLKHLLLDNFVSSKEVKNAQPYTKERIESEYEYFKGFMLESLEEKELRNIFQILFNVKNGGSNYYRSLPSQGSNPSIILDIFDKLSFKPDFPDKVYSTDAILLDFKCKEKYDLIISNNVFELTISPSFFFQKMHKLLKDEGLIEATILRNNKELSNPYFEEISTVPNAGKAYGAYEIFRNADTKMFSKGTSLDGLVKILRKK